MAQERRHTFKDEFTTTDYTQRLHRVGLYFSRVGNSVTVFCPDWDAVRTANRLAVEAVAAFL